MLSGLFLIKNFHIVVSLWENVRSAYEYLVICWTHVHSTGKYSSGSFKLDVPGSVHHNKIHKEKSNKMQQCLKILLFHIYMKLKMFWATHRPSSGA
jgi:hypothetical protein